jgi:hypothetical protein
MRSRLTRWNDRACFPPSARSSDALDAVLDHFLDNDAANRCSGSSLHPVCVGSSDERRVTYFFTATSINAVCCSFVLITTNRIDGLVTASQIATASFASILAGFEGEHARLGPATASFARWRLGAKCADRSHEEIGPRPKFSCRQRYQRSHFVFCYKGDHDDKAQPVHLLQVNLAAARLKRSLKH